MHSKAHANDIDTEFQIIRPMNQRFAGQAIYTVWESMSGSFVGAIPVAVNSEVFSFEGRRVQNFVTNSTTHTFKDCTAHG